MTAQVIMIDDNEDDLLFSRIVFERSGSDLNLVQFTSAVEALAYFQSGALSQPALVLLDINMPGMGGFEFLEAYQGLPSHLRTSTVIVMLTSSIDDRDRVRALSFPPVKGFVSKPLERNGVADLLKLVGR